MKDKNTWISTSNYLIDKIFEGGIPSGEISVICGSRSIGKSYIMQEMYIMKIQKELERIRIENNRNKKIYDILD